MLDRYEDCLRMVRKWGLYGEANARRPSLIKPIQILEKGTRQGQGLDLLGYEALLFQRSVDLLSDEKSQEMEGNSAWDIAIHATQTVTPDGRQTPSRSLWAVVSRRWTGIQILRFDISSDGTPGVRSDELIQTHRDRTHAYQPSRHSVRSKSLGALPKRGQFDAPRNRFGHSRAILIGRFHDRDYLIFSVAQERTVGLPESIYIYSFHPDKVEDEALARCVTKNALPVGESVYSLLDLGDGKVLVGMRGLGGKPVLRLLTLATDLNVTRHEDLEITSADLGITASKQNQVWALARATGSKPSHDSYDVVVGCSGGEVWRIAWPKTRRFSQNLFEDPTEKTYTVEPVVLLGSPVMSLAYRRGSGKIPCRVFAGGSDGSVIGLQRIARVRPGRGATTFASLWATWEGGGPVTRLQLVATPTILGEGPEHRYPSPSSYLAVVTRAGYCTLFDDRVSAPEPLEGVPSPGPHRIPFPGCRHGRFDLQVASGKGKGEEAFAAAFLTEEDVPFPLPGKGLCRCCTCDSAQRAQCPSSRGDGFGRFGVLLSASGRGTLRLLGLHLPDLTYARRKAFKGLIQRWWKECRNREGIPQLRLGEAALGTTEAVSLALARWLMEARVATGQLNREAPPTPLLPPSRIDGEVPFDSYFPRRWQLPRNLRPLIDLRRAWHDVPLRGGHLEGAEARLGIIEKSLEATLNACRRHGDIKLYQETCEVVLRNANKELVRAADSPDRELHAWARWLYFRVFEVVERSLELWLGRPDREESRARITVAKNLVDGITVLSVIGQAARESVAKLSEEEAHFIRVLEKRTLGVQQLVFKRDALVSLETLRATNLSLIRMCRALVLRTNGSEPRTDFEEGHWAPRKSIDELPTQEIRWEELSGFFNELLYSAARAFQSSNEFSDAVSHEYARAFALVICACPSACIRIANLMTEARLVLDPGSTKDMGSKVELQFDVLGAIGVPVQDTVRRLFGLTVRGLLRDPLEESIQERLRLESPTGVLPLHHSWVHTELPSDLEIQDVLRTLACAIGLQNAEDFICIQLITYILHWLDELVEGLTSDVRRLQYTLSRANCITVALEKLRKCSLKFAVNDSEARWTKDGSARPSTLGLYSQSIQFWTDAFLDKQTSVEAAHSTLSPTQERPGLRHSGPIRPDLLSIVDQWGAWAEVWESNLNGRFESLQIFQPEFTMFRQTLRQLGQVARQFRESAAVQKAVVAGVLGHHLLEDLDEHILELEEIAQSLNPELVRRYRKYGRVAPMRQKEQPLANAFSAYLLRRAHKAASFPDNLRKLYSILDPEEDIAPQVAGSSPLMLGALLSGYQQDGSDDWSVRSGESESVKALSSREAMHLELVLAELQHNHRKYSGQKAMDSDSSLKPSALYRGNSWVWITFPFLADREHFARLDELISDSAQGPVAPADERGYTSSGTGIYLANLAAAVVGWRLEISWAALRHSISSQRPHHSWAGPQVTGDDSKWLTALRDDDFWSENDSRNHIIIFQVILQRDPALQAREPRMKAVHVLVVDDVSRFAMHLWRYLAGTPGFGIGNMPKVGGGSFWKTLPGACSDVGRSAGPFYLETPDGRFVVWWVEARPKVWEVQLEEVFVAFGPEVDAEDWLALVDVRGAGPTRSGLHGNSEGTYSASEVVRYLEENHGGMISAFDRVERGNIFLVSSYRRFLNIGGTSLGDEVATARVLSKTGSTFERQIVRRFSQRQFAECRGDDSVGDSRHLSLHILVTGAGFELPDPAPGTSLGILATDKIIEQALGLGGIDGTQRQAGSHPDSHPFPVPEDYVKLPDWLTQLFDSLNQAAKDQDLDTYWDELLQIELLRLSQETHASEEYSGRLGGS